MVKIIKKNNKIKREDVNIIPFLKFYCSNEKRSIQFTEIPPSVQNRPDYYVSTINSVVEIKEIHDEQSNARQAQWETIINRLQKATNDNKSFKQVKGTYVVNTQQVFKLYKFDELSSQIIQEITNGINEQKTINLLGINLEIKKVSDQGNVILYSSFGGAGFIDPADIIYRNIKDKLLKADRQLGFEPKIKTTPKKILLLVNKYYFPLYNWDLFKAISKAYEDLIKSKNIDEIWYQLETKEKIFVHKLLYKKNFFHQLENGNLFSIKRNEYEMFASWFSALSDMGDDMKSKLFRTLKSLLNKNKAKIIFPEDEDREQMVRLGLWLIEKNNIKDAEWLINKFIDDPDPPEPGKYKGKPEFNYDQIIREGKDSVVITTVLGHLAWVVKELASRSERHKTENLIAAYKYTEKILTTKKNIYIVQQWLIPLTEIANRRMWLAENDPNTYKRFRNLILNRKDGLVVKYSKYPALAKSLAYIFDFFKDLTTDEVKFVLDNLMGSDEGFKLLTYYALYRRGHYKSDSEIGKIMGKITPGIFNYSPSYAYQLLQKMSIDKENKSAKLRSNLAWQCWRILEDSPKEFETLKQLLDNLFNSPYNKEVFSFLLHVLEENYDKNKKQYHIWFMTYLRKLSDYVTDDEKGRNTWTGMDKIIPKVVDYKQEDLPFILEKLTTIWLKGAYIGDLTMIFTTYKNIEDKKIRLQTKELSQKLYKEIRNANSRVSEIRWD